MGIASFPSTITWCPPKPQRWKADSLIIPLGSCICLKALANMMSTALHVSMRTLCTTKSLMTQEINHGIILETKIILIKGNGDMRPLGLNVGSLDAYLLHPSLGFFLLFIVAGFKARAPSDGEHKLLECWCQSLMACHPLSRGVGLLWLWNHRRWAPMLNTCFR
jgi:hypothetical protein